MGNPSSGLILENKGKYALQQKMQDCPVKEHNCEFSRLFFPNLRHLEGYTPLKTCGFTSFNRE